jgi:hypothetical protein
MVVSVEPKDPNDRGTTANVTVKAIPIFKICTLAEF